MHIWVPSGVDIAKEVSPSTDRHGRSMQPLHCRCFTVHCSLVQAHQVASGGLQGAGCFNYADRCLGWAPSSCPPHGARAHGYRMHPHSCVKKRGQLQCFWTSRHRTPDCPDDPGARCFCCADQVLWMPPCGAVVPRELRQSTRWYGSVESCIALRRHGVL